MRCFVHVDEHVTPTHTFSKIFETARLSGGAAVDAQVRFLAWKLEPSTPQSRQHASFAGARAALARYATAVSATPPCQYSAGRSNHVRTHMTYIS